MRRHHHHFGQSKAARERRAASLEKTMSSLPSELRASESEVASAVRRTGDLDVGAAVARDVSGRPARRLMVGARPAPAAAPKRLAAPRPATPADPEAIVAALPATLHSTAPELEQIHARVAGFDVDALVRGDGTFAGPSRASELVAESAAVIASSSPVPGLRDVGWADADRLAAPATPAGSARGRAGSVDSAPLSPDDVGYVPPPSAFFLTGTTQHRRATPRHLFQGT